MQRKKQEQIKFWFQYIEELELVSTVFDLKNLLKLHERIPVGFTREEMVNEAIVTIKELEIDGYLKIVKSSKKIEELNYGGYIFDNIIFEFTKKFERMKVKEIRKRKFEIFKKESEFWLIVVAVIVAIVSLIIQIFKK